MDKEFYKRFVSHRKKEICDPEVQKIIDSNQPGYFNGNLGLLIHYCCKKKLTAMDIDTLIWYKSIKKKMLYFIEQKTMNELCKSIQNDLFNEMQQNMTMEGYYLGFFYIIGNPPYDDNLTLVINKKDDRIATISFDELVQFLNMDILFDNFKRIETKKQYYQRTGKTY